MYFAVMLKHVFTNATKGVYLHKRSDGKLFNIARLRAWTKIRKVLDKDLLFANDQDVVNKFTYLGAVVTDDFSLNSDVNRRIVLEATTFAMLTKRV